MSQQVSFVCLGNTVESTKGKSAKRHHYKSRLSQGRRNGFQSLYHYMKNFYNLIGLEQWYFSLI